MPPAGPPPTAHWSLHALQWNLVGPPLRPCDADIAAFSVLARAAPSETPRSLILGVTPETINLGWPPGTVQIAIDRSYDMISHQWTGGAGQTAICANWCSLPAATSSFGLAIGDGAFNVMEGRHQMDAFMAELHRALAPGGRLVLRVFIRPEAAETPEAVFAALRGGRIGSFHAFKWRLAMALHGPLEAGVRLADIWSCWRRNVPEPARLLRMLGWDERLLRTIDVYRDVATSYCFPTLPELTAVHRGWFDEISRRFGDYELGERCPILELRRR